MEIQPSLYSDYKLDIAYSTIPLPLSSLNKSYFTTEYSDISAYAKSFEGFFAMGFPRILSSEFHFPLFDSASSAIRLNYIFKGKTPEESMLVIKRLMYNNNIFYKAYTPAVFLRDKHGDINVSFACLPKAKKHKLFSGGHLPLYNSFGIKRIEESEKIVVCGSLEDADILQRKNDNIKKYAFVGDTIFSSITIPSSVTTIHEDAFVGSGPDDYSPILTRVNYNGDIASWCRITFENPSANPLYSGKNLYIDNAQVTNLTIPNGVTSIGDYAFYECESITSVTIPNSVTSIGKYAFYECESITSLTIQNGVTSIGQYAFDGCTSITSVTIPNSVTSIGEHAFQNCPIETATIPALAANSIRNSALTSVIITGGTTIDQYAFASCTSLTNITIPNSVERIWWYAIRGCYSLTSITYQGTMSQWEAIDKGMWDYPETGDYVVHCTDGDIPKA